MKAHKEGILDEFTIHAAAPGEIPVGGKLVRKSDDDDFIRIKINDNINKVAEQVKIGYHFNINFHTNRMAFQIQYEAIKWFKEHNLHSILINNPTFDEICSPSKYTLKSTHDFRYDNHSSHYNNQNYFKIKT